MVWVSTALGICAGMILTTAIFAALGNGFVGYPAGELFYAALFNICHQYPTRSFWIARNPLGICARCTGGYTGVVAAAVLILLWRNSITLGMILSAGIALATVGVGDALLKVLAGLEHENFSRSLTGLLGGMGVLFLFFGS
jgi:uncharacterized membrane protein